MPYGDFGVRNASYRGQFRGRPYGSRRRSYRNNQSRRRSRPAPPEYSQLPQEMQGSRSDAAFSAVAGAAAPAGRAAMRWLRSPSGRRAIAGAIYGYARGGPIGAATGAISSFAFPGGTGFSRSGSGSRSRSDSRSRSGSHRSRSRSRSRGRSWV